MEPFHHWIKVNFKSRVSNSNNYDPLDENFITDKDGFFEFEKRKKNDYNILATIERVGDRAVFGDYRLYQSFEPYQNQDEELTAKAFLFSDRSIYRPGQTVFFKGILIKTKEKKSSVVAGQYVEVTLEDANGQNVDSLRLKTNSYGSFSGEFKLPANGLTGEYTIRVDEDDEDESRFYDKLDDFYESNLVISVEEYKRPTFEVAFKPVKESFKLNDTIRANGNALTFSGAKVSGAKLSYRIKRNVRYPNWYYWGKRNSFSPEQEIDHGELMTNAEGEFFIKFKAIPDEKILKDGLPVFEFEITADVTDISGETRSATTNVKVGYHSLIASINSPASFKRKIQESSFSVGVENLNSQAVPSIGSIAIYKFKSPQVPQRPRPWTAPDLQQIPEDQFLKMFPCDQYDDDSGDQWKKGRLMTQIPFNTSTSSNIKFKVDKSWELGGYIIELITTDETGDQITAKHRFELVDPANNSVADNKMLIIEADKPSYNIGEIAKVKIGSASKDITVVIDVERKNKIVKTYVKHLTGNYTEIQIPIAEGAQSIQNL